MGMDAFHGFLAGHITTGAVGLVAFWVPVLSKKGGALHLRWGRIFNVAMIATGAFATGMALCTIADPLGTHPFMTDGPLVAGIFGWMMLYLAFLTVNLAVYGWLCIRYRRRHEDHRQPLWIASQALLFVAAVNCAWQGWLLEQVLMMGISVVGIAAAATNLYFMFQRDPVPWGWQLEHIKALVGAGISVYTAFLAFGAVRLMPELALSPVLWSFPLGTGLGLILYHQAQVRRRFRRTPAHG